MTTDSSPRCSGRPLHLSPRRSSDHKGTFGRAMLIGGSRGMAGSIALSCIASLHTGSGLVTAAVPDVVLETVAGFHPALMTIPVADQNGCFAAKAWAGLSKLIEKQDAVGVGPGMTTNRGSVSIVKGILKQHRSVPRVIDADALNVIAEQGWFQDERFARETNDAPIVLTPHPGELARLTGVSADDGEGQLDAAADLAKRLGLVIVMKGGPTRIVDGETLGELHVFENNTGNPAMATAGCGDVLTGVIASLLGQGLNGSDAARLGVWIHGRAGDVAASTISAAGMTARHLVETLASIADEMTADEMTNA